MTITAATPKYDRRQPSKGAYDAIVYIDGSEVVAEDSDGRKIASGVAGTNDAAVTQLGYNSLPEFGTMIMHGTFVFASTVNSPTNLSFSNIIGDKCKITAPTGSSAFIFNSGSSATFGSHSVQYIDFWGKNFPIIVAHSTAACGMQFCAYRNRFVDGTNYAIVLGSRTVSNIIDSNQFMWITAGIKLYDDLAYGEFAGNLSKIIRNTFNWVGYGATAHMRPIYSIAGSGLIIMQNSFEIIGDNTQRNGAIYSLMSLDSSENYFEHIHGDAYYLGGTIGSYDLFGDSIGTLMDGYYAKIDTNNISISNLKTWGQITHANAPAGLVYINSGDFIQICNINMASTATNDGSGIISAPNCLSTHIRIDGNNLQCGHTPIFLEDCDDVNVVNNTILNPDHAVVDAISCVGTNITPHRIKISSNSIGDSHFTNGIKLLNVNDALLESNCFHTIVSGFSIAGNRNKAINNSFFTVTAPWTVVSGSGNTIRFSNSEFATDSSGSSTGTGSEQTIAHGLAAIPTGCKAWIRYPISATVYAEKEIRMDATNIYPKVKTGLVYDWRVE
jgi:hypothetical protein